MWNFCAIREIINNNDEMLNIYGLVRCLTVQFSFSSTVSL